jgi:hypothetical protein
MRRFAPRTSSPFDSILDARNLLMRDSPCYLQTATLASSPKTRGMRRVIRLEWTGHSFSLSEDGLRAMYRPIGGQHRRTEDVSPQVTQDVLLMAGAKDHYMPLQMLPDQLMTLTEAHSITARVFTEAESAQNHCQIGNMGLALKVILDWLDETRGRTAESADRQ